MKFFTGTILLVQILTLAVPASAQDPPTAFTGILSFDYTGTLSGNFDAGGFGLPDSTYSPQSFAGSTVVSSNDTSSLVIFAFEEVADESYDVYFTFLRDDSGGVEPQTWNLSPNLTDMSAFSAFLPGIDSTFVANLQALMPDSIVAEPPLDSLLMVILGEIAASSYIAASGALDLDYFASDSMSGSFSGTYMKVGFPPPTIIATNGNFAFSGIDIPQLAVDNNSTIPVKIQLTGAWPNPFNPATAIGFTLAKRSRISLSVYDVGGRRVSIVLEGYFEAGTHSVSWNAASLPSGIYLINLNDGNSSQTQKVTLLK